MGFGADAEVVGGATRSVGDRSAVGNVVTYGVQTPNAFPEVSFRDASSFAAPRAMSASTVAELDAAPQSPRATELAGCPGKKAVCLSSGYGGSYEWKDVITTDQSVLQEDQEPYVETIAAIFPAQPESESSTADPARGWGGVGWGDYGLTTVLTQRAVLFDTDLYRVWFRDGHVWFAPGTTCSDARRLAKACPDRYWANGTLAPNWEQEQRRNLTLAFEGKPPGKIIGAYPPGRWARVKIAFGLQTKALEPGRMGKLFVVTAEVAFQGATISAGSVVAYAALEDRVGPLRVAHEARAMPAFSPPPLPPMAPGADFPPPPPENPAPPPPFAPANPPAPNPPGTYPPVPPDPAAGARRRPPSPRAAPAPRAAAAAMGDVPVPPARVRGQHPRLAHAKGAGGDDVQGEHDERDSLGEGAPELEEVRGAGGDVGFEFRAGVPRRARRVAGLRDGAQPEVR